MLAIIDPVQKMWLLKRLEGVLLEVKVHFRDILFQCEKAVTHYIVSTCLW